VEGQFLVPSSTIKTAIRDPAKETCHHLAQHTCRQNSYIGNLASHNADVADTKAYIIHPLA